MASKEIRSNAGRILNLPFTAINSAPNTTPSAANPSAPHIRLASKAPNGLPTTGFIFGLFDIGGNAVATAPGFTVQIYLWNPVAQRWQSFAAKTAVNYDELYQTYDVDGGCELFFSITNQVVGATLIGISVCEQ